MFRLIRLGSNFCYVAGLRTLLTFHDLELYRIAFLKTFISVILNRAVVNKYIGSVFTADEAKSFCVIESLNGSFQTCHLPSSVTCIRSRQKKRTD